MAVGIFYSFTHGKLPGGHGPHGQESQYIA